MCHEINQLFQRTSTEFKSFKNWVYSFKQKCKKNQKELLKIDGAFVEEKQEIKHLGVHIDNRLTIRSEVKILLKKWPLESKNHIHNSQLFTKIIFKTNLECSCFESPSLRCRSHSIDWKKSFSVNRKTNQLRLGSFFLLVEIWVKQRTEIRT